AIIPAASIRATPAQGRGSASGRGAAGRGTGTAARATAASGPPAADREIRVTIVNDTTGPADTSVRLEIPQGWTSTPPSQPVKFDRADESRTVRFMVKP